MKNKYVCISAIDNLIVGEVYTPINFISTSGEIFNIRIKNKWYKIEFFKLLEDIREEKLNKIL